MYHHLLLPTDGSELSVRAFTTGIELARVLGARVTGLRNANNAIFGESFAGNFYEVSLGLNWTPTANWTVRPELRYDWFDGVSLNGLRPYDAGTQDDQFLLGFDAILLW